MKRHHQGLIAVGMAMTLFAAAPIMAKDYENHWAKSAIDTWSGYGIIKGYEDGTFKPSGKITRAELAVMLDRALGLPGVESSTKKYTDIIKGSWYEDAVASVLEYGVMYTTGTEFKPNQNATREEVAYAIAEAYQIKATTIPTSFKDSNKISSWAKSSIDALVSQGLIKGYEDGTFKPQGEITRAEFVTILDNVVTDYVVESGTYTEDFEGNVMITAPGTVLKDITIKGNLYLAPALGNGEVILENVNVEGTIHIQGGKLTLAGDYNNIAIYTTEQAKLTSGTIKNLHMKKSGAKIELAKNTVVDHLTIYEACEILGEGAVKQKTSMIDEKPHIESAGVYINGAYEPVDMIGDTIVIDVQKMIKEHGITAKMDSLIMHSSHEDLHIKGYRGGKFLTNANYDFRRANEEIGLIQEMIDQVGSLSPSLQRLISSMGLTGNTAFDLMGMGSSIELGTLVDQYYTIGNLVSSYAGAVVPQSFEFKYDLYQDDQKVNEVKIKLVVQ